MDVPLSRAYRLGAGLGLALAALLLVDLARLLARLYAGPAAAAGDLAAVAGVLAFALAAIAALAVGAARVLGGARASAGLPWLLGGACLAMAGVPGPQSLLGALLALLFAVQLGGAAAAQHRAGAAALRAAADTPAMRRLYALTLAAPAVVIALLGVYVKLRLDRAGKTTLGWAQGVGYALMLLLPFAAGYLALALLVRRYLRRRLPADAGWVAQVGVPCWAGALAGAVGGGAFGLWPLLLNVEASMVVMIMPWWFLGWQLAGALGAGALAFALAQLVRGARGRRA